MREIEFRGKKEGNGEWAYGYLSTLAGGDCLVIEDGDDWNGVVEETVGQYTGLKDKNGTKIYEGDVVKDKDRLCYVIKYTDEDVGSCGCCYTAFVGIGFVAELELEDEGGEKYFVRCQYKGSECQVIGNIYDNPELVEDAIREYNLRY